jgi:hypothetical protein
MDGIRLITWLLLFVYIVQVLIPILFLKPTHTILKITHTSTSFFEKETKISLCKK